MTRPMGGDKIAQILLRQGLVTELQIERALLLQKERGGRIGSHLLALRFVSEGQLVDALGEQTGVPGVALAGRSIPAAVLDRLPIEVADEFGMLPFQYDADTGTLHVAMADPTIGAGIQHARHVADCSEIKVYVAVDSILRRHITQGYHARRVFLDESADIPAATPPAPGSVPKVGPQADIPQVFLVARTATTAAALRPIFEREGYALEPCTTAADLTSALRDNATAHVLVEQDMESTFAEWVRSGAVTTPQTEVSVFPSVTSALLHNPASYRDVVGSLIRSLQQLAELRCAASPWKPPYVLICEDLRNLAVVLGFRRLAVDGMQIAAHLLVPGTIPAADAAYRGGPAPHPAALAFAEFDRSLEIAQALRFAWDVVGCLQSFSQLVGDLAPQSPAQKVPLAAQILALVWYRHSAFRGRELPLVALKAELRRQSSCLAAAPVVETYVRLIEHGVQETGPGGQEPVLVISTANDIARHLSVHLKYGGFRVVEVHDMQAARKLVPQVGPRVVLVDAEGFGAGAVEFCDYVKHACSALVYAFSSVERPSQVLELIDSGFDDAYVPPINYNVVVARIARALEALGPRRRSQVLQGFGGSLEELPFVDLVQAFARSQRSVRIQLESRKNERALVHMRRGRIVHAVCGTLSGAEAVFRVIAWGDLGRFSSVPASMFPAENVTESTDTLLFEGCRRLDEGRR